MNNWVRSTAWTFEDGTPVKSINSRFAVNMCCVNTTNTTVEALWLDFNGEEISYGHIRPGQAVVLQTYLTHPWVFRKIDNRKEVLLVNGKQVVWPSQTQTFVDLEEATLVPWNTTTHRSKFISADRTFARHVRKLLLTYFVQRNGTRRSCDVGRRRGNAEKGRRSGTSGAGDNDGSSAKASVSRCGLRLWHWRGLQDCNALHIAASMLHLPAFAGRRASAKSTSTATATSHTHQQPEPQDGLLGQLPFDIILEIIGKMAPPVRDVKPVLLDDIELMPLGVQPAKGPVALLAAKMMGPHEPPAPVANADAWFAAANAGAFEAPELADIAAMLGFPPNGQLAPAAAAAAATALLSPQVLAIIQYLKASVLVNVAMLHRERMALHAQIEARMLKMRSRQQAQAEAQQQQAQQAQEAGEGPAGPANGNLPGGGQAANQEQVLQQQQQQPPEQQQQQFQAAEGDGADLIQAEAAQLDDTASEYNDAQDFDGAEDYVQQLGQEREDPEDEGAQLGSEGDVEGLGDEMLSQDGHLESHQGLTGEENNEFFEDADAGEGWVTLTCGTP